MARSLVKAVGSVVVGASGAHLVTLGFYPVLTRLFSPESLGVLGLVIAFSSFFSPIMTAGYQWAIPLPFKQLHRRYVFYLCLIAIMVSAIMLVALFALSFAWLKVFFLGAAFFILVFSPVIAAGQAVLNSTRQYLASMDQFSDVAKLTFYLAVVINLSKIGWFAMFGDDPGAVTAAVGFSYLVVTFYCAWVIQISPTFRNLTPLFTELRKQAWSHAELVKYRVPQELLNSAAQIFPVLLIGAGFGASAAGYFTLARTIMSAPISLISGSVGFVILPRLAYLRSVKQGTTKLVVAVTIFFALSGIPIFLPFLLFGEEIFVFAFGERWLEAGSLAEWLSLWFYSMYVTGGVNRVSPVLKAYRSDLFFSVLKLLVRVAAVGWSIYTAGGLAMAVVWMSIVSSLVNMCYVVWFIQVSLVSDRQRGET